MISVNLNELRKTHLFVATPMYGGQCTGVFASAMIDLNKLFEKHGLMLSTHFMYNESLITRARNYCVDAFLRSNATHMMFIDADIGFQAVDILALLQLQTGKSNYDIIGGAYPAKSINFKKVLHAAKSGVADQDPNILQEFSGNYVYNTIPGSNNTPKLNNKSPVEVLEIGTGFMMIRRQTFEAYLKHYPDIMYKPDHLGMAHFDGSRKIGQYFQAEIDRFNPTNLYKETLQKIAAGEACDIQSVFDEVQQKQEKSSDRYLSEDYLFCQNVRKIGMKVWLCPWMRLRHFGTYAFSGKPDMLDAALEKQQAEIAEKIRAVIARNHGQPQTPQDLPVKSEIELQPQMPAPALAPLPAQEPLQKA